MTPQQIEYDDKVLPHLRRIRHCAKMVGYYTKAAQAAADQLPFLPDWLTRAEADLCDAMAQMQRTIEALRERTREKV